MFKIYQVQEVTREYEEERSIYHYNYDVKGSYLHKEKAEELLKILQDKESKRRAWVEKCEKCPVNWRGMGNDAKILAIKEYCEDFVEGHWFGDPNCRVCCDNENKLKYSCLQNRDYQIVEVEVEE